MAIPVVSSAYGFFNTACNSGCICAWCQRWCDNTTHFMYCIEWPNRNFPISMIRKCVLKICRSWRYFI